MCCYQHKNTHGRNVMLLLWSCMCLCVFLCVCFYVCVCIPLCTYMSVCLWSARDRDWQQLSGDWSCYVCSDAECRSRQLTVQVSSGCQQGQPLMSVGWSEFNVPFQHSTNTAISETTASCVIAIEHYIHVIW